MCKITNGSKLVLVYGGQNLEKLAKSDTLSLDKAMKQDRAGI